MVERDLGDCVFGQNAMVQLRPAGRTCWVTFLINAPGLLRHDNLTMAVTGEVVLFSSPFVTFR